MNPRKSAMTNAFPSIGKGAALTHGCCNPSPARLHNPRTLNPAGDSRPAPQAAGDSGAPRAPANALAGGALARIRCDQLLLQQDVATRLRVSQPHVAGLEQQADMLLSTLQRYVQALGGQLEIFARFDNVSFCLTRREAENDRA